MSKIGDFLKNDNDGGTSATLGLPSIFTNITAGENIKKGDLVTLGDDNLGYWAMDNRTPGAGLRPLYQFIPNPNDYYVTPTIVSADLPIAMALSTAKLSNGNFVVSWQQNAAPFNVQFQIFDAVGTPLSPTVTVGVGQDTTVYSAARAQLTVAALAAGGFAISYVNAGVIAKYAVYGNDGALVNGPTSVEATAYSQVFNCNATALASGGFVVAYWANNPAGSSYMLRFAVYNAAGIQQIAPASVKTIATFSMSVENMSVCSLNGGGFVIAYNNYVGTVGRVYFQRFNDAGQAQGAETAVAGPTSNLAPSVHVWALTTGFVVAPYFGGSSSLNAYSANGALQGVSYALDAVGNFNSISIVPMAADTFSATWEGANNNIRFASFTAVCTVIGNIVAVGSGNNPLSLSTLSDGGFVIGCKASTGASFYRLTNQNVPAGAIAASPLAALTNNYVLALPNPISGIPIWAMVYSGPGVGVGFGLFRTIVRKSVFVGVATADAVTNGLLPIQIGGVATLRLQFKNSMSVDTRAQSGQKFSILGNTIILGGIQA